MGEFDIAVEDIFVNGQLKQEVGAFLAVTRPPSLIVSCSLGGTNSSRNAKATSQVLSLEKCRCSSL